MAERVLIDLLIGESSNPFSIFEGMIPDENFLLLDEQSKNECVITNGVYTRRFFWHFANGDYAQAEKWSKLRQTLPNTSIAGILNIYYDYMQGLLAFQMYRNGKGESYYDEGKKMLRKMELYAKHSSQNCINKYLLLQAEAYASEFEVNKAKETYIAAIRSSTCSGRVYDQAQAYEFMGKYLSFIVDPESSKFLSKAHECYMQCGAFYLAKKLKKDHKLDFLLFDNKYGLGVAKRERGW
eukprot:CAMPEP_0183709738 /NCGR_PEP_ID=MMETSP0737-20130205/5720_1 /TAXON_ID=385413 /ORGANISM="Thalassiosira miniscula, Strain CCMP1093" /LENGTH=238 /DNA_ID=CAMNT_0025937909 /DNA_START=176 /DNA_END=892 /DNA_ORIENTATION=-